MSLLFAGAGFFSIPLSPRGSASSVGMSSFSAAGAVEWELGTGMQVKATERAPICGHRQLLPPCTVMAAARLTIPHWHWPGQTPSFQTWKARLAAPDISSALLHWPWARTHLSCKVIFQWGSLPPQPVPAGQPPRLRIRCISTQFSAPLSPQQGSPALCKGQPFSLRLHTSQDGELTTF